MHAALIDKFDIMPSVSSQIIHPVSDSVQIFGLPSVPIASLCNCSSNVSGPALFAKDP